MDSSQLNEVRNESDPSVDDEQLVSCLTDEYKILQDKIDKIGAFRFTIKGWSITVIIAALFAGTAAKSVSPWLLVICLFVVLALFFHVENTQTTLSRRFGQRTIGIEAVLSRMLRRSRPGSSEFVALRFVPGIAHHLAKQHPGAQHVQSRWRWFWDTDFYFYFCQALVVVAVISFHSYGKDSSPPADQVIIFHGQSANEPTSNPQAGSTPGGSIPVKQNPVNDAKRKRKGSAASTKKESD